ncbi:MAG: hypothetical protein ABWK04_02245 [Hydrogenobacter sp.]|uniref:hypothetical protein n=1 Tax=Hydrogenobacter thermophilus TaxID=940 RepID=UPI0030F5C4CD
MYYVLPSSKRQSRLKAGQYIGTFEERFAHLHQKAERLIRCFGVYGEPLPLWRRFKNRFWDSLEYWVLPPAVQKRINDRSLVLSPLFGIASVESPIPEYHFGWEDICEGVKVKDYWIQDIKNLTRKLFEGKKVVLFVGKETALLELSTAERVITFEYYRGEKKVRNPMRHRAFTLRYIAEMDLALEDFSKINFYDYSVNDVIQKGKKILFVLRSEGRYI